MSRAFSLRRHFVTGEVTPSGHHQAKAVHEGQERMDDVAKIRELVSKTYRDMVVNHDSAGYAGMYAEGVLWCPPNAPDQTTRNGIAKHMQGAFDKLVFNVEPGAEEVEVMGDFAYAVGMVYGRTTPRAGGDDGAVKFRILWLFRKESGEWKIHRQIWNNKP